MKQLLLDYFFKHVENKKDAIALCDTEGNSMTYGELADWSGKFWMYFQKKEIGTEDIVVIHMKRSIYLVSAILGVMRSGAAFTVAEAGFASGRLDYIVKDTRAKLVLDVHSDDVKIVCCSGHDIVSLLLIADISISMMSSSAVFVQLSAVNELTMKVVPPTVCFLSVMREAEQFFCIKMPPFLVLTAGSRHFCFLVVPVTSFDPIMIIAPAFRNYDEG